MDNMDKTENPPKMIFLIFLNGFFQGMHMWSLFALKAIQRFEGLHIYTLPSYEDHLTEVSIPFQQTNAFGMWVPITCHRLECRKSPPANENRCLEWD